MAPQPAAAAAAARRRNRSQAAATLAPSPCAAGQEANAASGVAMIRHPKYGRGTVLRREGDGEDAKLTVSFPGYGLKKLVRKVRRNQED